MNIKQAISRVDAIDAKLDSLRRFAEESTIAIADIALSRGTFTINLNALIPADERAALLDRERQRLEEERAKLQPVIDMANAALKGVLS